MKRSRFWLWLLIILLVGGAFGYGMKEDNPVNNILFPLEPTPTPDTRHGMNEEIEVNNLSLSVVKAWRVVRLNETHDLGIVEVKFKGEDKDCFNPDYQDLCTFYRSGFTLYGDQGQEQSEAQLKLKPVRGLKYAQLTASRSLSKVTSEQGQLYWLLDKEVDEYTLEYKYSSQEGGEKVLFKIIPVLYDREVATENLTTTPQPVYRLVEEKD